MSHIEDNSLAELLGPLKKFKFTGMDYIQKPVKKPIVAAIEGAKGGSTPSVAPNTLRSDSWIRCQEVLGEGTIQLEMPDGSVANTPDQWRQCVFLNGTPVANTDGSLNYLNFGIDYRNGGSDNTTMGYMAGFPDVESSYSVGVTVTTQIPSTRTVTSAAIDAVRVSLGIPNGLFYQDANGNVSGSSFGWAIDVKPTASSTWTLGVQNIESGKCESAYNFDAATVSKPAGCTTQWDIRVRRTTPDVINGNDGTTTNNVFQWASYAEIQELKPTYPNTAYVGFQIDAQTMNGQIPTRSYQVQGLWIQYPTNYTPLSRANYIRVNPTYNGTWNGTFTTGHCSNPAWVLYDLLTNVRYGLGQWITPQMIDKYSFYNAAVYCDTLVNSLDPNNPLEPLYTFNNVISQQDDAIKVLQSLAGAMGANIVVSGGLIKINQDRPTAVSKLVTKSDVKDGIFTRSDTPLNTRYTACDVIWNDPTLNYGQNTAHYQDQNGINEYNYNVQQIAGYGCTSLGQATRLAMSTVYTSINTVKLISFTSTFRMMDVEVGDVIEIYDEDYTAQAGAGRIKSATLTSITLDQAVTLNGAANYISFYGADGYTIATVAVNEKGSASTVTFSSIGFVPTAGSDYIITSAIAPEQYRVMTVKMGDDESAVDISCSQYDPNKYLFLTGQALQPSLQYSAANLSVMPQVTGITFTPSASTDAVHGTTARVHVSWDSLNNNVGFLDYMFQWRKDNGNWSAPQYITVNEFDITPAYAGTYEVMITAQNLAGTNSPTAVSQYVFGYAGNNTMLPPASITLQSGFGSGQNWTTNDLHIQWAANPQNIGLLNQTVASYHVQILNNDTGAVLGNYVVPASQTTFVYQYTDNVSQSLPKGPSRNLMVKVWTTDPFGQDSSGSAQAIFHHPAPAAPSMDIAGDGNGGALVDFTNTGDTSNIVGYMGWWSTTNNVSATNGNLFVVPAQQITSGINGPTQVFAPEYDLALPLPQNADGSLYGATFYFVGAAYDAFSNDPSGLNVSSVYSVNVGPTFVAAQNLVNNAVTQSKIAAGAVGAAQINVPALDSNGNLAATTVGNSQLAANAVTANKTNIAAINASTGNLSAGSVTSLQLAAGAVTAGALSIPAINSSTGQLASGVVTTSTVANGAITAAQTSIAAINSSTGNLSANSVNTLQIASGAVTNAQLAANAVTSSNIAANAVTATQIAANAVTTAAIQSGAVTNLQLAANSVQSAQIAANAVTSSQIAANAVTAAKTSIAAIDPSSGNLVANSVTATQIVAGTITAAQIATGTITASQIAANAITAGQIAANTITAGQIAAGTITAAQIASGSITTSKLVVTDLTNMVPNADFTQGTGGMDGWSYNSGTVSFVQSGSGVPANCPGGSGVMITANATTEMYATMPNSSAVPCSVGDVFALSCQVALKSGTVGNFTMQAIFLDKTKTYLNWYGMTITPGSVTTGTWTTESAQATAPANAAYVLFKVSVPSASGANSIWYATNIQARKANNANMYVDGTINATKLVANSITANQLQANSVTSAAIAANTIVGGDIAANTITGGNIAAGTITASNILANTITAGQIAAGTITATQIASNTITSNLIAANTIVGNNIAANTITGNNLVAGTITATQIAAGTITGNLIAGNTIAGSNIVGGTITGSNIAAGTITSANILANTITAGQIATGTITANQIATGTITANQIAAGTITGNNIAANTITGGNIVAGTITSDKLLVGSLNNLVPNGSWQTADFTGWTSSDNASLWYVDNSKNGYQGGQQCAVVKTPGGTTATNNARYNDYQIQVAPGDVYYFGVQAHLGVADTHTNAQIILKVVANDGSVTWPTVGTYVTNTTAYTLISGQYVVPANVAYIQMGVMGQFNQSAASSANQIVVFSDAQALRVSSAVLIQDGSITAGKIVAGTITSSQIAANTITGANIAAGTIAAGNLVSGSAVITGTAQIQNGIIVDAHIANLNGQKITAGSITAGQIAAGTIDASKLNVASLQAVNANTGNLYVTGTMFLGLPAASGDAWGIIVSRNKGWWQDGNGGFILATDMNYGNGGHTYTFFEMTGASTTSRYFRMWKDNAENMAFDLNTDQVRITQNQMSISTSNVLISSITGQFAWYGPNFSIDSRNGSAYFGGTLAANIVNTNAIVGASVTRQWAGSAGTTGNNRQGNTLSYNAAPYGGTSSIIIIFGANVGSFNNGDQGDGSMIQANLNLLTSAYGGKSVLGGGYIYTTGMYAFNATGGFAFRVDGSWSGTWDFAIFEGMR